MANKKSSDSLLGQIVVAVVIALLVGGSAPWWWRELFPERPPPTAQPPTPETHAPTRTPADPTPSPPPGDPAGCVVTIVNPLVALRRDPAPLSQELIAVEPGEYPTLEYTVTEFAGQDMGWFAIEVAGRRGWVQDDTLTIAAKTDACP
ncbi:MAG TPA: hypothetical protein PKD53_16010 [Chloroflexaceae bacterium]|nr:hypothetical protein [Chloroflexaceae bacterium]